MKRILETLLHQRRRTTRSMRPCDRCVLCGRATDVSTALPIDRRDHYIEGCGQLCRNCWKKLYGK